MSDSWAATAMRYKTTAVSPVAVGQWALKPQVGVEVFVEEQSLTSKETEDCECLCTTSRTFPASSALSFTPPLA